MWKNRCPLKLDTQSCNHFHQAHPWWCADVGKNWVGNFSRELLEKVPIKITEIKRSQSSGFDLFPLFCMSAEFSLETIYFFLSWTCFSVIEKNISSFTLHLWKSLLLPGNPHFGVFDLVSLIWCIRPSLLAPIRSNGLHTLKSGVCYTERSNP